jgi:hypothetical protein
MDEHSVKHTMATDAVEEAYTSYTRKPVSR